MKLETELGLELPFEDVHHETTLNIVRTANLLAALGANLFRRFDLTEAQFNVLMALKYRKKDLTQSDLSKRLVVTRASITSVLDRLESKKLVARRRVVGNRRIHHVELTSRGEALLDEVEPLYRHAIRATVGALDDHECRTLIAYLERIRERAQALPEVGEGPRSSDTA